MDLKEQSRFIIGRFDHYFDSINNKGVFYITISTFLLGGVVSQIGTIISMACASWWIYTLLLGFIGVNLSSIALTILALNPFKSAKCGDTPSLIYYKDIACRDLISFSTEYSAQSETTMQSDFSIQIYLLAQGLKRKFDRLRYAGMLLLVQFVLLMPLLILAIFNVNN